MKVVLLAGAATAALMTATPTLAQSASPDQAELAALVRAQAQEIANLRNRLDKIEAAAAAAPLRHGWR